MNTTKTTSNNRARWAAIGAAVAVSLGAGGLGIAQATVDSGPMNIYQAINPCRLSDTRPAPDLVGPRTTPLGANETYTFDGWGTVGNCTLPSNTAALEVNVTAIGATAPTFLTLFPAGGTMPTASNLNPVPGEPPTPNSVTVTLAADGKFSIFNAYGSVNFIIDVVGYYEDHMHRGEDIVDSSLTRVDIADEARVISVVDERDCVGIGCFFPQAFGGGIDILAGTLFAPSNGFITVDATIETSMLGDGANSFTCRLVNTTTGDESADYQTTSNVPGAVVVKEVVSLNHTFSVDSGANAVQVHCETVGGSAGWFHGELTATYVSTTGGLLFLPPITIPIGPIGP